MASPWSSGSFISGPGASAFGRKNAGPATVQNTAAPGTPRLAFNDSITTPDAPPVAGTYAPYLQSETLPRFQVTGTVANRSAGYVPPPDVNLTNPLELETAFKEHGQELFSPMQAQQFYEQHGQDYLAPDANQQLWEQQQSAGPMRNNAQTEYDAFGARRPNIATEPGYGSYYDNAEKKTVNKLNTQLAARGAYGSSVGLGQIGQSIADLRADQARTEADYNLRRLTEQRGWDTLGGELARNADLSGQGNLDTMGKLATAASDSRLAGLKGANEAATAAGKEKISGQIAGYTAAGATQGAHVDRINTMLSALVGNAGSLSDLIGKMYDGTMSADEQAMMSALLTNVMGPREALNFGSQNNVINQVGTAAQAGKNIKDTFKKD